MPSMQKFPETAEEFMEEHKLVDVKQVYSGGTEFVPIFRMKQWFEHEKAKRGDVDDLYLLLDENEHVISAMYLTKDQATGIEHTLDVVSQCGYDFSLVSATDGASIPDFRPKKGES